MWVSASTAEGKKNDQGKWDHNGAHRNSSLGPEKHGAVVLCVLGEDSDTVYVTKEKLYDTWGKERRKRRWRRREVGEM